MASVSPRERSRAANPSDTSSSALSISRIPSDRIAPASERQSREGFIPSSTASFNSSEKSEISPTAFSRSSQNTAISSVTFSVPLMKSDILTLTSLIESTLPFTKSVVEVIRLSSDSSAALSWVMLSSNWSDRVLDCDFTSSRRLFVIS